MKIKDNFKSKFVLVTGSSSGIGFQIARDFLESGAMVGVHYRKNKKGAERLQRYAGIKQSRMFQADFYNSDEVRSLWKEFISWSNGKIDILVNNAGEVGQPMNLDELDDNAWNNAFQINVKAPFILSQAALSVMSKQHSGRIINISSIGVKFGGSPKTIHYSVCKAALEALTKSLAKAAAPCGILVNCVRAGVTDTPLHEKTGRDDLSQRIAMIPMKRLARPSEISQVVKFLSGENNSFITNTIIDVAGGE